MNILVTQGHELGIGLEVFFKSCLTLPTYILNSIELIAFKNSVLKTLITLRIPFKVESTFIELAGVTIKTRWQDSGHFSESLLCLNSALDILKTNSGVLFTLPTSKDQFPQGLNGHTEYFRAQFNNSDLGMFFSSPHKKILLITDHISLARLSTKVTRDLIVKKTLLAFKVFKTWGIHFDNVYLSGLNPHCGEGGLMGDEDKRIFEAVTEIKKKSPLNISGPFSGDTLYNLSKSPRDLFIYMYHDQGLAPFKATQGFIGSNITLGLPFPRLSPDHGTSFNLFGKNIADYRGCSYSLRESFLLKEKIKNG